MTCRLVMCSTSRLVSLIVVRALIYVQTSPHYHLYSLDGCCPIFSLHGFPYSLSTLSWLWVKQVCSLIKVSVAHRCSLYTGICFMQMSVSQNTFHTRCSGGYNFVNKTMVLSHVFIFMYLVEGCVRFYIAMKDPGEKVLRVYICAMNRLHFVEPQVLSVSDLG